MTNSMPTHRMQISSNNTHTMRNEQGNVVCVICQAEYTPSRWYMHLLQGPPVALESAFMSMCHFCFRCRRPACPECWDDVNGVCGECAQEARLDFRREAEPFTGVIFSPAKPPQVKRERRDVAPLVCVEHGRFLLAPSYAENLDEVPTWPLRGRRRRASSTWQGPSDEVIDSLTNVPTRPVREPSDQRKISARPVGQERIHQPATRNRPPDTVQISTDELDTQPDRRRRWRGTAQWFESMLTLVLGTMLLVVAFLIALTSVSTHANALVSTLLHVDIRAEVAYLLQLANDIHL